MPVFYCIACKLIIMIHKSGEVWTIPRRFYLMYVLRQSQQLFSLFNKNNFNRNEKRKNSTLAFPRVPKENNLDFITVWKWMSINGLRRFKNILSYQLARRHCTRLPIDQNRKFITWSNYQIGKLMVCVISMLISKFALVRYSQDLCICSRLRHFAI